MNIGDRIHTLVNRIMEHSSSGADEYRPNVLLMGEGAYGDLWRSLAREAWATATCDAPVIYCGMTVLVSRHLDDDEIRVGFAVGEAK